MIENFKLHVFRVVGTHCQGRSDSGFRCADLLPPTGNWIHRSVIALHGRWPCSTVSVRQNHIASYKLLAAHAVGVSSGSRWMDDLASPGRIAVRYSRTRILSRRQVSTMERIAATRGPAFSCPMVGPIATANRHRAHGVLREVVAQFQLWIVEEAREFVPQPKGVGRCLAEWTRRECRSAGRLDLRLEFCEHQRSPFLAQHMTRGVVHALVTRLGIDGKQFRHLRDDSRRGNVLLIELGRLHNASS
jgi:hypothetical protein